jgi:hypothetical protein
VDDWHTREILGQFLPAVAALFFRGASGCFGVGIGGGGSILRDGCRRGVKGVGNQERLIGIESFGARAVEASQQEIEPMLELLVFVPSLTQHVEQFADHLLEDDGIVGQRRHGVGEGNGGGGTTIRAHALLDARRGQFIL